MNYLCECVCHSVQMCLVDSTATRLATGKKEQKRCRETEWTHVPSILSLSLFFPLFTRADSCAGSHCPWGTFCSLAHAPLQSGSPFLALYMSAYSASLVFIIHTQQPATFWPICVSSFSSAFFCALVSIAVIFPAYGKNNNNIPLLGKSSCSEKKEKRK